MEDKKSQLQKQADQLLKLGVEIDELHDKIETARDNLIQIYFSIRSQNNRE